MFFCKSMKQIYQLWARSFSFEQVKQKMEGCWSLITVLKDTFQLLEALNSFQCSDKRTEIKFPAGSLPQHQCCYSCPQWLRVETCKDLSVCGPPRWASDVTSKRRLFCSTFGGLAHYEFGCSS